MPYDSRPCESSAETTAPRAVSPSPCLTMCSARNCFLKVRSILGPPDRHVNKFRRISSDHVRLGHGGTLYSLDLRFTSSLKPLLVANFRGIQPCDVRLEPTIPTRMVA